MSMFIYSFLMINIFGINWDDSKIVLTNKGEFCEFMEKIAGGNDFSGKEISLSSDIDISDCSWRNYIADGKKFNGTFDGGRKSIVGLDFSNDKQSNVGLFSILGESGEIKNLNVIVNKISNTLGGNKTIGCIAGINEGKITGCCCKVLNNISVGSTSSNATCAIGGIAGENENKAIIENCYAEVRISNKKSSGIYNIGGIVGRQNGTVRYCYSLGSIILESSGNDYDNSDGSNAMVGGICGYIGPKQGNSNTEYCACFMDELKNDYKGESAISKENGSKIYMWDQTIINGRIGCQTVGDYYLNGEKYNSNLITYDKSSKSLKCGGADFGIFNSNQGNSSQMWASLRDNNSGAIYYLPILTTVESVYQNPYLLCGNVYVGGAKLTKSNSSDILGDNSKSVYYNAITNSIVLNKAMLGLSKVSNDESAAIYSDGDLNLEFNGNNAIDGSTNATGDGESGKNYGILVNGVLNILGDDKLEIKNLKTGIKAEKINHSSGALSIENCDNGIESSGEMNVNTGSSMKIKANDNGFVSTGKTYNPINILGGDIELSGGKCSVASESGEYYVMISPPQGNYINFYYGDESPYKDEVYKSKAKFDNMIKDDTGSRSYKYIKAEEVVNNNGNNDNDNNDNNNTGGNGKADNEPDMDKIKSDLDDMNVSGKDTYEYVDGPDTNHYEKERVDRVVKSPSTGDDSWYYIILLGIMTAIVMITKKKLKKEV